MVLFAAATVILLAVGNVAAQSIGTYSFLVPVCESSELPTSTFYGTIVSSNPTKTTYIAGCVSDKCVPTNPTPWVIFGPSSLDVAATFTNSPETEGPAIASLHCDFTGTTQAVCIESISGANGPQSVTAPPCSAAYQTVVATKASADQISSSTAGKTTASGMPSATTGAKSSSTKGTGSTGASKGAGAHMCPSKGGILAAFVLWGLLG